MTTPVEKNGAVVFPRWKNTTKHIRLDGDRIQSMELFKNCKLIKVIKPELPDGFSVQIDKQFVPFPAKYNLTYTPSMDPKHRETPERFDLKIETSICDLDTEKHLPTVHSYAYTISVTIEADPPAEESDTLRCSTCVRSYSDTEDAMKPRSLSRCGHSFCLDCIKRFVVPKPGEPFVIDGKPQVRCPTCRKTTIRTPEKLPINWPMVQVIREKNEMKQKAGSSKDERVENPIIKCYEDEGHEADVYCPDCNDSYCRKCFLNAHTSRKMSHHLPVSLSERPFVIPMCPEHPDRNATFVCEKDTCTENKVVCPTCRGKYHKNHAGSKVEDKIKFNEDQLKLNCSELKRLESEVDRHRRAFESSINSFEPTSAQYGLVQGRINDFYESQKSQAIAKFKYFVSNEEKRLKQQKTKLENDLNSRKELITRVETTLKRKSDLHLSDELITEAEEQVKAGCSSMGIFFELKDYEFDPTMKKLPGSPKRMRF